MSYYTSITPLESPIPADRQGAKRHYGVHPYFTRRPYNIVREYILRYSRERDRVLDPFGGSGVTAIEAYLENRIGIQNDINPLANFIAKGIANLRKGSISDYRHALAELEAQCRLRLAAIEGMPDLQLGELMAAVTLPENVPLPSNSDVGHYYELFSTQQLLALAVLRDAIRSLSHKDAAEGMLLAWSATLSKLNRTFLSAEGRAESRGGSSIFSIYRYKIAKTPVELSLWKTFEERAQNVIAAKAEIDRTIDFRERTGGWCGRFRVYAKDVECLPEIFKNDVDYIFTDPPYGGHISYLDLSTLWNAWLGVMPTKKIREREVIVGGEMELSEATYLRRLASSVKACIQVLKRDRWLSIVFQHWNPAYFDAILTSAAENGADLRAAVPQVGDTIWSMHKKKGAESVLAGEMILTFYKTGMPAKSENRRGYLDTSRAISDILSAEPGPTIHGERIFNQLILAAWKKRAVESLHISKDDFNDIIRKHGWAYDETSHCWVREQFQEALFDSKAV